PPITLKSVDLPQPEGPMTERNSPGRTISETLSTAVIGPSGVSKRTTMSSAPRTAVLADPFDGMVALLALARHRCGRGSGVAGLDADVDDGNRAGLDRGNGLRKARREIGDRVHRTEALRALRARHAREIDVGLGNALPDPAVFDWPIAHPGDTFLMQFVVEEGAIIGDDDQQWTALMRRGPERRHAHQEIAVAADRDRKAAAAFQRQCRGDRTARTAADAATAIRDARAERMIESPGCAIPRKRHVGERGRPASDRFTECGREMIHRQLV